jgi:3-oxoadipate enol-lactonase
MKIKAVGLAFFAAAFLLAAACGDGETPAPGFTPVASFVPNEEGLVPVETGFAEANGARLYYEVYGEGQPLLLIPGSSSDHVFWTDEVPVYAPEFKVIVFDPRGTAQSSFPEGVDLTMAVMADDAAALLDALGVDSAHVYGISLGGMVAQEMALRHPERVRSLTLAATSPGGTHSVPMENWALEAVIAATTQGVEAPNFLDVLFSTGYQAEHRAEAIEYFERMAGSWMTPQLFVAQAKAQAGHDTYDRLPSITAPTLVIHGTDDPLVPTENGRILAQRIPIAELVLVEGGRHGFLAEKQTEIDAAVLDFLRRHNW